MEPTWYIDVRYERKVRNNTWHRYQIVTKDTFMNGLIIIQISNASIHSKSPDINTKKKKKVENNNETDFLLHKGAYAPMIYCMFQYSRQLAALQLNGPFRRCK